MKRTDILEQIVKRVDPNDLRSLAALVGDDWLEHCLSVPIKRLTPHPLTAFWVPVDPLHHEFLRLFDRAVGLVLPLLTETTDGRDRKNIACRKLRDPKNFWSTVPELLWSARLAALNAAPEVERDAKGPDVRGCLGGQQFAIEIYAPVLKARTGGLHHDLRVRLERPENDFHLGLYGDGFGRTSQDVHALGKEIDRIFKRLRSRELVDPVTIYVHGHRTWTVLAGFDDFRPSEEATADDSHPWYGRHEALLRVVIRTAPAGSGLMLASSDGASSFSPHDDMTTMLSDLGQLDRNLPNVLVVDARQSVVHPWAVRELRGTRSPFERHPELSAIIFSQWGVYSGDSSIREQHEVVETTGASAMRLSPEVIDALARPGLF